MGRSHHVIGLNSWALNFIANFTATTYDIIEDIFSNHPLYNLQMFHDPETNKTYREFIQEDIWSGGPNTFTALEDEIGQLVPESLWEDEDMYEVV